MPRVSEEYRRAQAQRILQAARTCFAQNGFHAVTMDQIIATAGVSSSTVYRYYPEGKTQLVHAVSTDRFGPLITYLEEEAGLDEPAPPSELLEKGMSLLLPESTDDDGVVQGVRLAVNSWAEAARDETVRMTVGGDLFRIRALITAIARAWLRNAMLPSSLEAEQIAELVMDACFGLLAGLAVEGVGGSTEARERLHLLAAVMGSVLDGR